MDIVTLGVLAGLCLIVFGLAVALCVRERKTSALLAEMEMELLKAEARAYAAESRKAAHRPVKAVKLARRRGRKI